jgi:hypothetical protein
MRRHKRWIIPIAILVVLPTLAALYVRAAYPPERLRSLIEPRLAAALQRPVELRGVALQLVPLAVRLDGVRVQAPPGFESPTLFELETLRLRVGVLPLLRRRLVATGIDLEGLVLWIEQRADSTWSFAAAAPPTAPQPRSQPEPVAPRSALDLSVEKLAVRGGALHFASRPAGLELHGPLAAELRFAADRALKDVQLGGWVQIDSLHGGAGGRLRAWRGLRLRLEPEVHVDVPDLSARVEHLRVALNDLVVDFEGRAARVAGRPELHLQTRAEDLDVGALLAAIPAGSGRLDRLQGRGTLRLDVRLDKPAAATTVAAHGSIALRDGAFQFEGLPESLTDVDLQAALSGDTLRLQSFAARLGDARLHAEATILDATRPQRAAYDVRLAAQQLDLERLSRFAPLPPGTSLAGQAGFDLRARGRAADRDHLDVQGPVTLNEVVVRTPRLLQPLHATARLQGIGDRLRIESAQVRAGTSQMRFTGFLIPALPPRRPRLELEGQASRLDLASLLPAAGDTAAAAAGAGAVPPSLLPAAPPLDLDATLGAQEIELTGLSGRDAQLELQSTPEGLGMQLRAAQVRSSDVTLYGVSGRLVAHGTQGTGSLQAQRGTMKRLEVTALQSDLRLEGRTLHLAGMRGKAYGGTLSGDADLDLGDPARPRFDLDVRAGQVDTGTFLGALTPLDGVFTGKLDLTSKWTGAGKTPEAVRGTLSADGQAVTVDGRIESLPVLAELASFFAIPSLKQIPYRNLAWQFTVRDGRMHVRDLKLVGRDADLGLSGSIGLDGGLDLALQVRLSEALGQSYARSRPLAALGSLFADAEGRLLFDFDVSGPYRAPRLQPDLQATAGRAQKLGENALRRLVGQLPQAIPGLGTPTPTPGAPSGRDPVQDASRQLGNRLRDLLGGGRSGSTAAPRADSSAAPDSARQP